MGAGPLDIVANFANGNGATVAVNVIKGGVVKADFGDSQTATCTATSSCSKFVPSVNNVTLTAVPDKGYTFFKWQGNTCPSYQSTNSTISFLAGTKDKECDPQFAAN